MKAIKKDYLSGERMGLKDEKIMVREEASSTRLRATSAQSPTRG